MRPAYVAMLFLVVGLVLLGFSRYGSDPTEIARRVRRRTGSIFVAVAAGLLLLDALT